MKTSSRKGYSYSEFGFYQDISSENGLRWQRSYHLDSDLLRSHSTPVSIVGPRTFARGSRRKKRRISRLSRNEPGDTRRHAKNDTQSTRIPSDCRILAGDIRDGVNLDAVSSVALLLVDAVLILSLPGGG